MDAMNELTGRFWEHPSVDVDTYHGFCQTFRLAIIYDTACRMRDQPEMVLSAEDCDHPCQPLWRADTVNAVVLLGLMLLDHAKGRGKNKDICHCMRMTLGQYLDALAEFTSGEEGMPGSSHTDFRLFGQRFLKSRDGSGGCPGGYPKTLYCRAAGIWPSGPYPPLHGCPLLLPGRTGRDAGGQRTTVPGDPG